MNAADKEKMLNAMRDIEASALKEYGVRDAGLVAWSFEFLKREMGL